MPDIKTPPPNMGISPEILRKLPGNQVAIATLLDAGVKNREIAKQLGLTEGWVSQTKTKLKKIVLTDRKTVKGARETIRQLSQGLPVGTVDKVRDSTALQASMYIFDQYTPPANISATQVNVDVILTAAHRGLFTAPEVVVSDSGKGEETGNP
jgi:beta-phosphoglucomutase-like phosphatase (HAD superfamily)